MAFTLISIAIELAVLLVIYRVLFFTVLKGFLWKLFEQQSWWEYLTTYEGLFSKNTQVEVVYVSLLGIHHLIGGLMMVYGVLYNNPMVYGHAALWELVDDINDLTSMIFLIWPFEELDLKMLTIMGFHHIFGVIIIVPVLTTGLYLDQDLQFIGIALLLAGAVSCLGLVISRTMDRRIPKEALMDFFMWLFNLAFFSLCRFYIFPKHLYRFFETTNWEANTLIISAAICMTIFNLLIFMDGLSSTNTRLFAALNNGEKHAFKESCRCYTCSSKKTTIDSKYVDKANAETERNARTFSKRPHSTDKNGESRSVKLVGESGLNSKKKK